MDTTPKYILMCEKAEEIQSDWKPEIGRYFNSCMGGVCMYTGRLHKSGWTFEIICENDIEGRQIWLPRQDELQEMIVNKNGGNHITLLSSLVQSDLLNQAGLGYYVSSPLYDHTESMEQLWLAFVMKEKYNKIWSETKKDWVKDGGS